MDRGDGAGPSHRVCSRGPALRRFGRIGLGVRSRSITAYRSCATLAGCVLRLGPPGMGSAVVSPFGRGCLTSDLLTTIRWFPAPEGWSLARYRFRSGSDWHSGVLFGEVPLSPGAEAPMSSKCSIGQKRG